MNPTNEQVSIDIIVSRYMVKYIRLNQLISFAFSKSDATHVNLYVDLYGLYRTILSRNYKTNMSNYTALTSAIINLCAHYRGYFKKIGVYTTIFLVSSYNLPENTLAFIPDYNYSFQEKLMSKALREMLELNIELLDIICPYLPDIFFIKTGFESSVMIDYLIRNEGMKGNEDPNIILSSDLYPIQLVNEFYNTVFLRPIKTGGEDGSVITLPKGYEGFDDMFWAVVSRSRAKIGKSASTGKVSACNFVCLEALNSFPERNIKTLLNVSTASKFISEVTNGTDIQVNLDMLYQLNAELANRVPMANVLPRARALDVHYQSLLFKDSLELKVLHYENLEDPNALQMINSKYFANDPLDLLRL